ncbi:MAG: glycosyltransferase, partial [Pseudomonadota bacterium]
MVDTFPSAPTVTIGLPVYNGEAYLTEALESLVSQSFADIEFIISDNASTDGTRDICESFTRKDSRIRYD